MNHTTQETIVEDAAILCDRGLRAYREQDYKTAIPYYQASAQLGSSAAMCNLRYCYYYGRGVQRDKEMAHYYWETSAVLGEAASTYKLGGMHRNGDIEADESVAWLYYCRAWRLTRHEKDILNYPNICLRLAQYGEGRLTSAQRAFFASEAAHWFEKRIHMGAPYSDDGFAQARELYEKLAPQAL